MALTVFKGHGTQNDFVVIPDLDNAVELTPELVRALCDRHAGIGADGVLRVARNDDPSAPYFMDYRNADGSIAEMCGNGVRVFVRYLQHAGLASADSGVAVATRGGIKHVRAAGDQLTVGMGAPELHSDRPKVTPHEEQPLPSLAHVDMPNPHIVVLLDSAEALAALDLDYAPVVEPPLPHGQNVEFVHREETRHLTMRVYERGVGETLSCGTGICAVVAAVADADGAGADGSTWSVDVPGGSTTVVWQPNGEIELTGPAELVAEISLDDRWLASVDAND